MFTLKPKQLVWPLFCFIYFQFYWMTFKIGGEFQTFVFCALNMESTIAGCLWLTMTYLACDFNPTELNRPPDATTTSVEYLEIHTMDYDGFFEFDVNVWSSLREVYGPNGMAFMCNEGLCVPINLSPPGEEHTTDNYLLSDKGPLSTPRTTFQEPTSKKTGWHYLIKPKPILSTSSHAIEHYSPPSTPSLQFLDVITPRHYNPTRHANRPISTILPNPDKSDIADELGLHTEIEEIALSASTGIFSLTTIIALIKCLCRKNRYARILRLIFGPQCCRQANAGYENIRQNEPENERLLQQCEEGEGVVNTQPQAALEVEEEEEEGVNTQATLEVVEAGVNTQPQAAIEEGEGGSEPQSLHQSCPPQPGLDTAAEEVGLGLGAALNTVDIDLGDETAPSIFELHSGSSSVFGESSSRASTFEVSPLIEMMTPYADRFRAIFSRKRKQEPVKRLEFKDSFWDSPV